MGKESKLIDEQRNPIHLIWDEVLMLPVYGIVDSKRGQEIMESILGEIIKTKSRVVILDILGVDTMDSAVANHLIKITKATRLMGADCIISGVSPSIAQTLVNLGIDLGNIETQSTLKNALSAAFKKMGMRIITEE